VLLPLLAFATSLAQPAAPAKAPIEGRWRNPSESVIIAIGPCGQSMCGRVEWASYKAIGDARKAGTDPLIGAELLSDIVPKTEGRWKARLFVPDINKTSRTELRLIRLDQLKVTGCAVGGLICRSQIWTRTAAE
jgi:uncharacterized protein (DUF2147 family)